MPHSISDKIKLLEEANTRLIEPFRSLFVETHKMNLRQGVGKDYMETVIDNIDASI